jgi:uncharacterized protein (DUF1501 family)
MCYGGIATFAMPMVRFAQVPGRGRLVFVLLRGGFDGLAAVVPVGDPDYAPVRGAMAYAPGALTMLRDGFGLAPGLAPWRTLWEADELVALHAMAIPYRTRSHFDGQAILETGLEQPDGSSDGWLNRLLQVMDGERSGIAIASGMPRSLSGEHRVTTWSPAQLGAVDDPYLDRLGLLYRADARLHDRFEAALQMREIAPDMAGGGGGPRIQIAPIMTATARILREPGGPNVAALEFSGWDTHANQGTAGGPLDRLLGQLASGIMTLREGMASDWVDTTVVIMTEFGRTAHANGTGGTDHGTAGAGFVIGPRVASSAVVSDWPGLSERELYQSRDVRPTLDTRAVLKGVVAGVFDLTAGQADRVFPGSEGVRGIWELMA